MIVTEGGRFGGYGLYLLKASRSLFTTFSIWSDSAGRAVSAASSARTYLAER